MQEPLQIFKVLSHKKYLVLIPLIHAKAAG